jgi:hypothetical protein
MYITINTINIYYNFLRGIYKNKILYYRNIERMVNTGIKIKKSKSKSRSRSKGKSKSISRSKSKSKSKQRSRTRSRISIKGGGGVPASYVGSIQGQFINRNGQQLFRNPAGGIA